MRKIIILTIIALIFMIGGVFSCSGLAYSNNTLLRVPLNETKERMRQVLLVNIAREEFDKRKGNEGFEKISTSMGSEVYYFSHINKRSGAVNIWDFVVKQAKKEGEFENRGKLGAIAPDAFIPWVALDEKRQLWAEELTDKITASLDECKKLFREGYEKEAEKKVKELADTWAEKYEYLLRRGIKCTHRGNIKIDDFGKSRVTGKWGFFDFGALEKADEPGPEDEILFVVELLKPLEELETQLGHLYSPQIITSWKEAREYSALRKNLSLTGWIKIWNREPPDNKSPEFRSKYLEALLPEHLKPENPDLIKKKIHHNSKNAASNL